MSFKTWWRAKNRKAKVVTTLVVLIMVNTGLCFLTPVVTEWAAVKYQVGHQDPLADLGLMMLQAVLDLVLLLVLFCVAVFWRSGQSSAGR